MSVPPAAVFFLSDYGLEDEFVGVVHAVIRRAAPGLAVVDLTHQVPAYDVRAGSETLWRAAPHLGPGVVLGVVDPGVGGGRRGLAVEIEGGDPRHWVGPDNGLLLPAAESVGTLSGVVELARPATRAVPGATTFDGRDVFAPAAAALASGASLLDVGTPVDATTIVRLPPHVALLGSGGHSLRVSVAWIDRFGNVQLAAEPSQLPGSPNRLRVRHSPGGPGRDPAPSGDRVSGDDTLRASSDAGRLHDASRLHDAGWLHDAARSHEAAGVHEARRVTSFSDLDDGELGAMVDANGRLALVCRESAAAERLAVAVGDLVELHWD